MRNTENKAQLRPAVAGALPELGKKWKIMKFIVATNVVASQQRKCRPTGTPTARANILILACFKSERIQKPSILRCMAQIYIYTKFL